MSEISASETRPSPRAARAELREQLRLAEEGRQLMDESKNFFRLLEYAEKGGDPGPDGHPADKYVYGLTVDTARKTQQRLREQSAAINLQIAERGAILAPEGHEIVVEFPKTGDGSIKTEGIDVLLDSPDGPVYAKTSDHWWRQSGIYAPLPDGLITRNGNDEYAFAADSLELASDTEFNWYGPTFYAYTPDRSARVLHGIGWTKVSIRPLGWLADRYPNPAEPVPESEWVHIEASRRYRQQHAEELGRTALF